MEYTWKLRGQFMRVYENEYVVLYPVQIGIKTDEDAIIVYGQNGDTLNIAQIKNSSQILEMLERLFPVMRADFAHLLIGNFDQIAEILMSNRLTINTEHKE